MKTTEETEQYFSTIILDNPRPQLLLASQNYNSNYAIYGSFVLLDSGNPDTKILDSVKFEIINYKPTLFIGIKNVHITPPSEHEDIRFKIEVQGMNNCAEHVCDITERIEIENGSFIRSERFLIPLFPIMTNDAYSRLENGEINCDSDNKKVFDSEFYFMDGKHILRKYNYDDDPGSQAGVHLHLPGKFRCKNGLNKVMFSK